MAHILKMPRQGNTVESCIITNWKVKEGGIVKEETHVCEVETDKASFEIQAGAEGTVLKILRNEGDDVPVMSPIAVIGKPGETWDESTLKTSEGAAANTENESKQKNTINNEQAKDQSRDINSFSFNNHDMSSDAKHLSISPRAKNLALKESLPANALFGTGPGGRIIERDVLAALENRPPLTLAAKASGGAVPRDGTGFAGRITLNDIFNGMALRSEQLTIPPEGGITETQIKGTRKIISEKMLKSLAETAQFTLNARAPVSRLQDLRSRIKEADFLPDDAKNLKITVNDLIMFAVSRVLPRFPFMNAHKTGDIIKTFERVHLGMAVDTPRGLMVPVIRDCNLLSLPRISSEAKRLAAACQNASVKPNELTGSTFSVTNLGVFGITGFTPVFNIPEVAILGVCGIELKPTAGSCAGSAGFKAGNRDSAFGFEPFIGFSLTINHQVVDGAPAARFLKALCEAVENIDLLLAAG